MNKITGTIIDAGYHLDAGPGVSIAANAGELRVWDGPLYGRRVVILDKADYDAREEGIEQLREQMGQLRVALAAREAEEERLRDAERQRVAEGMSRWCKPPQSPHLEAIDAALEHAKTAGAEVAAWAAQLADVVRVLRKSEGGTKE